MGSNRSYVGQNLAQLTLVIYSAPEFDEVYTVFLSKNLWEVTNEGYLDQNLG